MRKLERLTAVYQQSMEHYRNESKMEYRDLTERMNKEAGVVKLLHQSLYDNITSDVQQATSHLNTSFKHAADEVRQRMQVTNYKLCYYSCAFLSICMSFTYKDPPPPF